jgi:ribosome biogenesis GTPase
MTQMAEGTIIKALSGFYYVRSENETTRCRARGIFRKREQSPLVGDKVAFDPPEGSGDGTITQIFPRKNSFVRPACANIDLLVIVAAAVNPITDPFLIDRMTAVAENAGCTPVICINKCDLDPGDALYEIYSTTGYSVLRTSAETGEGIAQLRQLLRGKVCAFSGNSGVGKSSILNALEPGFMVSVGEVSEKLGRGKHTTRHVELFRLGEDTYIADTPGFASFDLEHFEPMRKEELQGVFPEFEPYLGQCRFDDCAHINEPDCAVREAVTVGKIHAQRYESYKRLYEQAAKIKDWERNQA